ncbi:L,D-transpeptidase scaffold domain-containing protein [Mucilaginibacter hurinus]|uniref:L,D-transpeptidase family protein n=1 Tax=Mucilaginibacter hurinus TaxID=2201324 RepID=UPI001314701F|nr:L,D-transpeptidase family protein [Mucilaginibacter hurinus]
MLTTSAPELKAAPLATINSQSGQPINDTAISAEITKLTGNSGKSGLLYFPNSVKRFYAGNKFKPAWLKGAKNLKLTWEAMLVLDCVLQFGLAHSDYHPAELSYPKLHAMVDTPANFSDSEKARFDIMLTDALLTLMNHLHYGKLNPVFTANKIDNGVAATGFKAENTLTNALATGNIMKTIANVQPKLPEYFKLQNHLRLLNGQYLDDCYDIPEKDVRLVTINMERLRWINADHDAYIHINIPSFVLRFYQPDTVYQFKVIVGKPATPTPVLQSEVSYFTTAPDWKVPARIFAKELLPKAIKDNTFLERNQFAIYNNKGALIVPTVETLKQIQKAPGIYYARQSSGCDNSLGLIVFRFKNAYSVYLHDTPEKKLFERGQRAFSHGCIRVENAGKLAELILHRDGAGNKIPQVRTAMNTYQTKTFTLKRPIPIEITYITCEVKDGELITYQDIYNKDKALEMALYNVTDTLAMK